MGVRNRNINKVGASLSFFPSMTSVSATSNGFGLELGYEPSPKDFFLELKWMFANHARHHTEGGLPLTIFIGSGIRKAPHKTMFQSTLGIGLYGLVPYTRYIDNVNVKKNFEFGLMLSPLLFLPLFERN